MAKTVDDVAEAERYKGQNDLALHVVTNCVGYETNWRYLTYQAGPGKSTLLRLPIVPVLISSLLSQ